MLVKFDSLAAQNALFRFERRLRDMPILFPLPPAEPHIRCLYLNRLGILQIVHNGRSDSEFLIFDLIEYLEAIASRIPEIKEIQVLDCLVINNKCI